MSRGDYLPIFDVSNHELGCKSAIFMCNLEFSVKIERKNVMRHFKFFAGKVDIFRKSRQSKVKQSLKMAYLTRQSKK